MDITKHPFRVGDIVAYEDQANPRAAYIITAYRPEDPWSTYDLVLLDSTRIVRTTSDCRQRGWSLISVAEVGK